MARSEGKKNETLAVIEVSMNGKILKVVATFNAQRLTLAYTADGKSGGGIPVAEIVAKYGNDGIMPAEDAAKNLQRMNRLPDAPTNAGDAFEFIKWYADSAPDGKRDVYRMTVKQFVTDVLKIAPEF